MFTSQKIWRTVFVSLYFDKIFYYANALDGMYVNAHKKWPSHKFLVCTSLLFNKNNPQVAARATRLQWLKIEQKHRMTSSTWLWGCRTKWVIGHRTWSIIGHSTILLVTYFSNLQFASLRLNTVKRTWHGDSMVGGALVVLLRLWKFATALRCHMVCIKTSHNAWMRPEYFITRHQEIHRSSVLDWWKQWRTDENPYCACPPVL